MEIYGVIPFFLSFIFACKIYHDFEDILYIIKKKLLLKTINKFFFIFFILIFDHFGKAHSRKNF